MKKYVKPRLKKCSVVMTSGEAAEKHCTACC